MAEARRGPPPMGGVVLSLLILALGPLACARGGDVTPTPGGLTETDAPTPTALSPSPTPAPDRDGDGFAPAQGDCDDDDAGIHPDQAEACDGDDNDCDGQTDEGALERAYPDGDRDGFGDDAGAQELCALPRGYVDVGGDCDDDDPRTYPDAPESCDDADNDCDRRIDEGVQRPFYPDGDEDGYGQEGAPRFGCEAAPGFAAASGDCDDANPDAHPGAPEICGAPSGDEDCDGQVDEGLGELWYRDLDEDGAGDPTQSHLACAAPEGYVATAGDCEDRDPDAAPDLTELCDDGRDNDCDGALFPCEPHPDCASAPCPTLLGTVISGPGGPPLEGAIVSLSPEGAGFSLTTTTDADGRYALVALPVGWLSGDVRAEGHLMEALRLTSPLGPQRLWTLPLYPESAPETGQLRSLVKDASTGQSLAGVEVTLYEGLGTGEAMPALSLTTTLSGLDVPLSVGNYTAHLSLQGYLDIDYPLAVSGGGIDLKDLALAEAPEPGALRATLTWGAAPRDLDLYLERRDPSGALVYTVFYDDRSAEGAQLELDDRNGSGPETLTLSALESDDTYRFLVRDYTNRGDPESAALGYSGAELIVYRPEGAPLRVPVPLEAGNLWRPLEIRQGMLVPCLEGCVEGE